MRYLTAGFGLALISISFPVFAQSFSPPSGGEGSGPAFSLMDPAVTAAFNANVDTGFTPIEFMQLDASGALLQAAPDPLLHPHLAGQGLEDQIAFVEGLSTPSLTADETPTAGTPTAEAPLEPQGTGQPDSAPPVVLSPAALALSDLLALDSAQWPFELANDRVAAVREAYADKGGDLLWHADGKWVDGLDRALFQIEHAADDGLRGDDYVIEQAFAFAFARTPEAIAQADLALTAMALPYTDHMANGRHARRPRFDAAELLLEASESGDLGTYLNNLIPQKIEYQRLRSALAQAREESASQTIIPELSQGAYLRQGQRDPRVAELRTILTLMGDLDPSVSPQTPEDGAEVADLEFFDETLHQAVLRFQERKSLGVDGIVGRGTRSVLNQRSGSSIALIKVNLERLRWEARLDDPDELYVQVNIPQYRLVVRDEQAAGMDMRVIVGRRGRQTPILSDRIVNLKFSPDWTVPSTIYREDILPNLRANPGYAAANGYSIIVGGSRVSAGAVDWSSPPPVTVYKGASANGPLGGVRFSMTNGIGIFLHDTNRRSLFNRGSRALSSGCVRVGDPAGLAHYLSKDQGVSRDEVQAAMNRGRISWRELSNDGVPVFLSYMTTFVDEEGTLQTTGDPYGIDSALLAHFDNE